MATVGKWDRRFRLGLILSLIGMVTGLIASFMVVIVREVHPVWMIAGIALGGLPGSVLSVIASIAASKQYGSKKQRRRWGIYEDVDDFGEIPECAVLIDHCGRDVVDGRIVRIDHGDWSLLSVTQRNKR